MVLFLLIAVMLIYIVIVTVSREKGRGEKGEGLAQTIGKDVLFAIAVCCGRASIGI